MEPGSRRSAWASQGSDTNEWLELNYPVPVKPSQVIIHQTYNPDQVVLVELRDPSGAYHQVYEGTPKQFDQCPYVLTVKVADADYQANGVRVTIDQSVLGLGWNEIDAVELVGTP